MTIKEASVKFNLDEKGNTQTEKFLNIKQMNIKTKISFQSLWVN